MCIDNGVRGHRSFGKSARFPCERCPFRLSSSGCPAASRRPPRRRDPVLRPELRAVLSRLRAAMTPARDMRIGRRDFVVLAVGTLLAGHKVASAQPAIPLVGLLSISKRQSEYFYSHFR